VKRISPFLALLSALCAATVAGAATTPTLTIAAPTVSGNAYYSGGTLWFRPDGSGSFTLNATATNVTSVEFPDVSSTAGWSSSTGGTDTTSPYESPVPYSWTAGATAPGAQKITATTDADDLTASLTIGADAAAPTGQTIAVVGGPFFPTTSVPLTISRGTDAASGIDTSGDSVERATAPLQNGLCGTFGSFSPVTLVGGADTSVTTASCNRWQVKVKDNVGNVSTASAASAVAAVDTTPPGSPILGFSGRLNAGVAGNVLYYQPSAPVGFTVTAIAADSESGVAAYTFPTILGAMQVATRSSETFSFTSLGSPPPPLAVTATNGAGLTSLSTTFALVPDSTPPTLSVLCNGTPCLATEYAGPVQVTFVAADNPGSGVDTIRYTTNGSVPSKAVGFDYTSGIIVRSLTNLKVRAYDEAGNAGDPVSLTIRVGPGPLVFGAPARVTVLRRGHYLNARLSSTRRAHVLAVMTGRGLATPQRWSFLLEKGAWIVSLRLPPTIKRGRVYSVRWTLSDGVSHAARVTQVSLR
jgi:hypothetical protein